MFVGFGFSFIYRVVIGSDSQGRATAANNKRQA